MKEGGNDSEVFGTKLEFYGFKKGSVKYLIPDKLPIEKSSDVIKRISLPADHRGTTKTSLL